jgi:hypothetical protein
MELCWPRHGISLERRHSWCVSTDPCFAQKAADVVGLYLNPPEHALVLSVDEKPHIQALERAQGWLKLPNGKALTGFQHDYKRHGTTTLFAALEVATGLVKGDHYKRRRRTEFLDFMNGIVAEHPGREIHVILDNRPEPASPVPASSANTWMTSSPPTTRLHTRSSGRSRSYSRNIPKTQYANLCN